MLQMFITRYNSKYILFNRNLYHNNALNVHYNIE